MKASQGESKPFKIIKLIARDSIILRLSSIQPVRKILRKKANVLNLLNYVVHLFVLFCLWIDEKYSLKFLNSEIFSFDL